MNKVKLPDKKWIYNRVEWCVQYRALNEVNEIKPTLKETGETYLIALHNYKIQYNLV